MPDDELHVIIHTGLAFPIRFSNDIGVPGILVRAQYVMLDWRASGRSQALACERPTPHSQYDCQNRPRSERPTPHSPLCTEPPAHKLPSIPWAWLQIPACGSNHVSNRSSALGE
eukprot:6208419-Pleurochrysis_carterae.AAC.7